MHISTLNIFDTHPHLTFTGSTPALTHLSLQPNDFEKKRHKALGTQSLKHQQEFGTITRHNEAAGSYKAKEATRSLHAAARLNLLAPCDLAESPLRSKKTAKD